MARRKERKAEDRQMEMTERTAAAAPAAASLHCNGAAPAEIETPDEPDRRFMLSKALIVAAPLLLLLTILVLSLYSRLNRCSLLNKDIIFLLESSPAVGIENFRIATKFASDTVEEFARDEDRAGLASFSETLAFSLPLNECRGDAACFRAKATSIADNLTINKDERKFCLGSSLLYTASDGLGRPVRGTPYRRRIIVVVVRSMPKACRGLSILLGHDGLRQARTAIWRLREHGIFVFILSIGDDELHQIYEYKILDEDRTRSALFTVRNYSELNSTVSGRLRDAICAQSQN